MMSQPFLLFLSICSAVSIFCSLFNTLSIRRFRNLAFLAIYIGTAASFFIVDWKSVFVGWSIFGVSTGILYYAYELYSTAKSKEELRQWSQPSTIIHGLFIWPIMLPEVIEYSLADFGVLKPSKVLQLEEKETRKRS